DLDQAAERLAGWPGRYHVTVAGPWTLAAAVAKGGGEAVLADLGARRDLGQAWVEAVAAWHGRAARLTGLAVGVQVDEPSLPLVMAGGLKTQSGLRRHDPVDPAAVILLYDGLAERLAAAGAAELAVHCCAPGLDVALMRAAGFTTVSLDAGRLGQAAVDALAEHWEAGGAVWLGVVPTDRPAAALPTFDALADRTRRLLDNLGADPASDRVAVTPACGLAGFSLDGAAATARLLTRLAAAAADGL
ncbi:MAG: methionine synthase, partial [Propionibacteriaceae bacterium]|nr:methionine synthase [Propionibacteriaceae bacterium]